MSHFSVYESGAAGLWLDFVDNALANLFKSEALKLLPNTLTPLAAQCLKKQARKAGTHHKLYLRCWISKLNRDVLCSLAPGLKSWKVFAKIKQLLQTIVQILLFIPMRKEHIS